MCSRGCVRLSSNKMNTIIKFLGSPIVGHSSWARCWWLKEKTFPRGVQFALDWSLTVAGQRLTSTLAYWGLALPLCFQASPGPQKTRDKNSGTRAKFQLSKSNSTYCGVLADKRTATFLPNVEPLQPTVFPDKFQSVTVARQCEKNQKSCLFWHSQIIPIAMWVWQQFIGSFHVDVVRGGNVECAWSCGLRRRKITMNTLADSGPQAI